MLHVFSFLSSVLDWIELILVWFERSLHSAHASGQSCPWRVKLMTAQAVKGTWIRTCGYGRPRSDWVKGRVTVAYHHLWEQDIFKKVADNNILKYNILCAVNTYMTANGLTFNMWLNAFTVHSLGSSLRSLNTSLIYEDRKKTQTNKPRVDPRRPPVFLDQTEAGRAE